MAFEEWAEARTASLLRFAHALTEDGPAAETAVRTALARARKDWATIDRHGDPDLMARRFVVEACPGRRRAAVVLRLLEERSDDEIAEVLGASRSFARARIQRGLATLQEDAPLDVLERGASSAPRHLSRPLAPADLPARGAGRSAWVAALAVLALVATVTLVARETRTRPGVITYPSVHVPTDWRYESYDGVQVRVPARWGFGGAPMRSDYFHGHLAGCGSNQAAVLAKADPATYVSSATPFVGRPAMMSYACEPWGRDGVIPSSEALWFGSPMAVGVEDVGSVTAETRAVGGQHVTVFSRVSEVRREILGTAEAVDVDGNGCPARAVQHASVGPGGLVPTSLSVCVYSQDTGTSVLMWSGRLGAGPARTYAAAVQQAGTPTSVCTGTPTGRWVALGLQGESGSRWDVVDLGCGVIEGPGGAVPMAPATVRGWARDGVTAYAIAGPGVPRSVATYFRPPLG